MTAMLFDRERTNGNYGFRLNGQPIDQMNEFVTNDGKR